MKWHRKTTSFGIWDNEERRVAVIVQDHPNEAMNSRLIAAAPQLLEALELLLWNEGQTEPNGIGIDCDSKELERSKKLARAAIAAATGSDIGGR